MVSVREFHEADLDAVVALSLRAWEPVFASMHAVLGAELARRLHGEDWRRTQAEAVTATLRAGERARWVAEDAGAVAGFAVAAIVDEERRVGELLMLAVDPAAQRRGIGRTLTEHAARWMIDGGLSVARIETGGDSGHAPARALYREAGYTELPAAQFYRAL